MMSFINGINPIILDTIVVSVFVLIIFFGVVRGIKNVLFDFFILLFSIFLGFTSYTKSIKDVVARILNISEFAPVGSKAAYKVAVSLFEGLVSSVCVFLVFYLLAHLIKLIVGTIIRKGKKEDIKPKSKWGRVFGGFLSLVYQGAFLIIVMLILNNNFTGMNETFKKSTIADFLVDSSEKLLIKIDDKAKEKLTIKVIKGDLLYVVDNDVVDSYEYIENKVDFLLLDQEYVSILDDEKLTNEEAEMYIKNAILDLNKLIFFVESMDNYGNCKKEFIVLSEDWLNAMHRVLSTKGMDPIEMNINECVSIRLNLIKMGLTEEYIGLYDEIVIGK